MLELVDRLKKEGYETYLVGGAVRDLVMHKESADIDVFTSAPLAVVKAIFSDAKIIDFMDSILVILNEIHYEVSTFRSKTNDIKKDLIYRDFTMNALLYDGVIHDYVGGIDDIKHQLIRTFSKERFIEDPLRILRALRFASTLGFEIEEKTKIYMYETKDLLNTVAQERIFKELKLLFMGQNVFSVMYEYVDVLTVIIPELNQMKHFNQKNPHHSYDLLIHTLKVIEHTPKDESLRLAALFHDFGKLDTFSLDEKGVGHFYGHEKISVQYAERYLNKFHADKRIKADVIQLVGLHGRMIHPTQRAVRRLYLKLGDDLFLKLIDLKKADRLGKKPGNTSISDLDEIKELYLNLKEEDKLLSLDTLKLKGYDLIKLGFKEGPIIGDILNEVLELCISEKLKNDKHTLIDYVVKKKLND